MSSPPPPLDPPNVAHDPSSPQPVAGLPAALTATNNELAAVPLPLPELHTLHIASDPPASQAPSVVPESDVKSVSTPPVRQAAPPPDKTYRLKPIVWVDPHTDTPKHLRIITQNRNGPCPLLALSNVLLLRGDVTLPYQREHVDYEHLVELVGEWVATHMPSGGISAESLDTDSLPAGPPTSTDFSRNLTDVFEIFPTLQTGLDVNVRFDSPLSFEVTPALLVFDLFKIQLCHGWTVDPQDDETHRVIVRKCGSYNRVVEQIIAGDVASAQETPADRKGKGPAIDESESATPTREDEIHDGLVCSSFLAASASQLTYHGLQTLCETLPANSLSVLFRNNHFSTLYKRVDMDGSVRLFTLVTDESFLKASGAVWETMDNVEGDSSFVDGYFIPFHPDRSGGAPAQHGSRGSDGPQSTGIIGPGDYADVMSPINPNPDNPEAAADHALALAMQKEEDRQTAMHLERQHKPAANTTANANSGASASPTHKSAHHKSGASLSKAKDKCSVM
ncbi:Ubiquitin carboxyl-terminal hydrolase MINDY-1 [Thoreauomyces humboldtii]|nr:Ubiquitin carboxyl-terminal hydrolase MINDY-1 [Thoreauomyces humboldtii]